MVDWVDRQAKYVKDLNNKVVTYFAYSEGLECIPKFPSCKIAVGNLEKVKKYIQEELQ